jgi:hypothetical protein
VEQVLDDDVEAVGVGSDVREHRRLDLRVEVVAAGLQQARVAEDRRDWGPELVRDQAEELVLDGVRCLEGVSSCADGQLGLVPLGDVDEDIDGPDHHPGIVEQRGRIRHERDMRAIRADGDRLGTADRPPFLERDRHRALVVAHRRLVQPEQTERPAPFLAQGRMASPEFRGGGIEEGDPAVGVGRVDRDAECVEEPAVPIRSPLRRSCRLPERAPLAAGKDAQQVAVQHRTGCGGGLFVVGRVGSGGHAVSISDRADGPV